MNCVGLFIILSLSLLTVVHSTFLGLRGGIEKRERQQDVMVPTVGNSVGGSAASTYVDSHRIQLLSFHLERGFHLYSLSIT